MMKSRALDTSGRPNHNSASAPALAPTRPKQAMVSACRITKLHTVSPMVRANSRCSAAIEVKAGPSMSQREKVGRSARHNSDIASAESRSAPPTPATGTLERSAFTSVWIKSIGNST